MSDRKITRRRFLGLAGLGLGAAVLLPGCSSVFGRSPSRAESDQFTDNVQSLRGNDTFTLLWTSDTHYRKSDTSRLAKVCDYYDDVFAAAEKLQPAALVVNGDLVDGKETIDIHKAAVSTLINKLASSPVKLMPVRGNHDGNAYYTEVVTQRYLPSEMVDTAWLSQNLIQPLTDSSYVFDASNPNSCYYYRDFPDSKIRMIVLDDIDLPFSTNSDGTLVYHTLDDFGFGSAQVEWLANTALRFNEAGWGVVVAVHVNFNDDRPYGLRAWGSVQGAINDSQVQTIFRAFADRASGRVTNTTRNFRLDLSYDFTGNASNELICFLNGHTHRDQCVFTGGFLNMTLRAFAASQHGCFDAVVIDRSSGVVHTRAYDAVSGVSPDWDINYRTGEGIPDRFNYYYGNSVINDASEIT